MEQTRFYNTNNNINKDQNNKEIINGNNYIINNLKEWYNNITGKIQNKLNKNKENTELNSNIELNGKMGLNEVIKTDYRTRIKTLKTEDANKWVGYVFLYYALISSLFWLISVIALYSLELYNSYNITIEILGIIFIIPLLVKVPLMPVHLWLNELHTSSPVSGSIFLAGIILKVSIYGIIIYYLPIFDNNTWNIIEIITILSISSIILSAFNTIRQIDIKRLIAYSSVNHMNIILFGSITYNCLSIEGSFLYLLGHGFISGILFLNANSIYERIHTRSVNIIKGIAYYAPFMTFFALIFSCANFSIPPFINWFSEFYIFGSNYGLYTLSVYFGSLTIIIAIFYSMWLFFRMYYFYPSIFITRFSDFIYHELFLHWLSFILISLILFFIFFE